MMEVCGRDREKVSVCVIESVSECVCERESESLVGGST